ncbi:MAG: D-alanyl-D-alanine carboxypeptidase family protein [bacterium]|nr:D-alanyl-D-alanine carboxypeptidase family protein [bacterium]
MLRKTLFLQVKDFLLLLTGKKFIGTSFSLIALSLLFFPNQGYYELLQSQWQEAPLIRSHFVIPPPVLYPVNATGTMPPELTARGILIMDPLSAVRLLEKNINEELPTASTAKMMTALVAIDQFGPQDVLVVPKLVDQGQDIKLFEGEQMTAENILYGLLVASANDAAETFAANYPEGKESFINKMNEKAFKLGLKNTHFTNPAGLDEQGEYTSAFDLAILAKQALYNPYFARIVSTQAIDLTSVDGKSVHKISNINQLLGKVEGVNGVKTGWTDNAGECLVTSIDRDGRKIIIVVLGSKDRFGETEKLINWVYSNFKWSEPQLPENLKS